MSETRKLHKAIEDGEVKQVIASLNAGADINGRHDEFDSLRIAITPLELACEKGNKDIVELLIMRGADLNLQDSRGRTALHLSVLQNPECTKLLLDHKANPNTEQKSDGLTPLMQATLCKSHSYMLRNVELLLEHKANPNYANRFGLGTESFFKIPDSRPHGCTLDEWRKVVAIYDKYNIYRRGQLPGPGSRK